MSVTTVRLRPEVEGELAALAGESRRSKSWLINEALSQYIAQRRQEDEHWVQTVAAMESVAQGRVVSGDSVHKWLRSWGTEKEIAPPKVGE